MRRKYYLGTVNTYTGEKSEVWAEGTRHIFCWTAEFEADIRGVAQLSEALGRISAATIRLSSASFDSGFGYMLATVDGPLVDELRGVADTEPQPAVYLTVPPAHFAGGELFHIGHVGIIAVLGDGQLFEVERVQLHRRGPERRVIEEMLS
jgi:hypothetical protein